MKRIVIILAVIALISGSSAKAGIADSTDVYLLTCAPGTESYSIYGHTAIRIVIRGQSFDRVYNWGLFDFSTPNFAFRFAKGKLDYMVGAYGYNDFLNEYQSEGRSVWSQKINFTTAEKEKLFELINENLKPENVKYRYDFFYDNCATRIRDIIEKAASDTIIYSEKKKRSTFRQLIDPNQKVLPWLDFGADFLLGLQADRKASASEEMFLPMYLMENLTSGRIIRNGNPEALLGTRETVIDFTGAASEDSRPWIPQAVFYAVLLFVVLVTFVFGSRYLGLITDIIIYTLFSVLALLMIFSNFFSDHDAMHYNLVILAINPIIPVLLVYILIWKKAVTMSRIALTLALLFFPAALIAGQGINAAIVPLLLILMVRLFKHCEFGKSL
ncbi:MAG TPA: DUF4105 domain-containing protein [Bacteroidales bacterium]|nr:DUF4105 domain-containing protein [Bacteroidales bacterium]